MTQPSRSKVIRALTKAGCAQSVKDAERSTFVGGDVYTEGFRVTLRKDRPYARVEYVSPNEGIFDRYGEESMAKTLAMLDVYTRALVAEGMSVRQAASTIEVRR